MTTLRGSRIAIIAASSLVVLGGCAGYNPPGLSTMSAVDLCEMQHVQGRNLSAAAKQTIQSELSRRNDNCGNHTVEVAKRYQDFMDRETYGKLNDP